jgi:hypothetical protein
LIGYKLRDKITNALRSRGEAIRTAIAAYNVAAAAVGRRPLTWREVVNMAELADFDLLRDVKSDIRSRPWADPQNREAMVLHFRITRAREEIHRLNIEIRRQVTYMQDQYLLYIATANRLKEENPNLVAYISKEAVYLDTIFTYVTFYLVKTKKLQGFSGTLEPGVWEGTSPPAPVKQPQWLKTLQGNLAGNDDPSLEDPARDDADGTEEDVNEETMMDLMENIVLTT